MSAAFRRTFQKRHSRVIWGPASATLLCTRGIHSCSSQFLLFMA
jgi:hypothetical protein